MAERTSRIKVNGHTYTISGVTLSYQRIKDLVNKGGLTITYFRPGGRRSNGGTITPGRSVKMSPGMVVTAVQCKNA